MGVREFDFHTSFVILNSLSINYYNKQISSATLFMKMINVTNKFIKVNPRKYVL